MDKSQSALWWLDQGVSLLPVQPNSKHLVKGFGLHQEKITTPAGVLHWWGPGKRYNLAVCFPDDWICLDFDDPGLYVRWGDSVPAEMLWTYQEISPRGYHVFYRGTLPAGLHLIEGVEIKRVVVVSPSRVSTSTLPGFTYRPLPLSSEFLRVDDWTKLVRFYSLLSDPLPVEAPAVAPVLLNKDRPGGAGSGPGRGGLVERIKLAVPIFPLASSLTQLKMTDSKGHWFIGCCPFHHDQHPSFWVNAERGLWGCYSCGERGDVINLYARKHDLTVRAAIHDLRLAIECGGGVSHV